MSVCHPPGFPGQPGSWKFLDQSSAQRKAVAFALVPRYTISWSAEERLSGVSTVPAASSAAAVCMTWYSPCTPRKPWVVVRVSQLSSVAQMLSPCASGASSRIEKFLMST
eukprot:5706502-Prymnesium_polylepis.2